MYGAFIGIWIIFLLVMQLKNNRPMLKTVSSQAEGNTLKFSLIGLAIGFGANTFCVLMSILMGDIHIAFDSFQPLPLLLLLLVVFIQSSAEELSTRCYLYQKLRRRYRSPWFAIIGNALLFGALHLANPGINAAALSQIVVIGILLSLMIYYYDSLWCCFMIHAAWNYTQNIIFGLPNSGIVSQYSIFRLEAASSRSGLFYNVNFGVEGSWGAVIVLAVIMVGIYYFGHKRGKTYDLWADQDHPSL